jgi:cysteine desulfurase
MDTPVYLDNHATTRLDPRVLEAMMPYLTGTYGNAASRTHEFGWKAREALELARGQVAKAIGALSGEIVFTSGATESDNLAILGVAEAFRDQGDHIVTTAIEHHAVLDPCRALERRGFRVTVLRPDRNGLITAEQVQEALAPGTILVSVMAANNEIGTLYPIEAIARAAKGRGAIFHCDAAQAIGKIPIDVVAMGIDLLSISGHKVYGPKGIGALFVRKRKPPIRLHPLFHGGGHEGGLRPGTPNVPGAVGLGEALRIASLEMDREASRIAALRDRLHRLIAGGLDGVRLNGHPERRLPGNLNLSFVGLPGEALVVSLKDLAVSSGSACTSATVEPSYVLRAIGVEIDLAVATIRFGLGRFTTEEEVEYAARRVIETVRGLREMARGAGLRRPSDPDR